MHRYTKFHLDMQALKAFAFALDRGLRYKVPEYALRGFFDYHVGTPHFLEYNEDKFPNIRKVEKMKYLRDLGFTYREIGNQLGHPGTSIEQFLKRHKDVDVRHFKDHPGMDELLKEWEPFRKLLPDDLFLKYTE